MGRLQTECGYTAEQARETTWPEYLDLAAYWSRHPAHGVLLEILARLWGWKPAPEPLPAMSYAEACAKDGEMFRGMGRWFPKGKITAPTAPEPDAATAGIKQHP